MNRKRRGLISLATAAGLVTMIAMQSSAQVPMNGAPAAIASSGQESRLAVIQRLGLTDPALRLTTAQRARIDDAIVTYLGEQSAIARENASDTDAQTKDQAAAAKRKAQDKLTAAISSVMSVEQRQTWESARAVRRARMEASSTRNRSSGNR